MKPIKNPSKLPSNNVPRGPSHTESGVQRRKHTHDVGKTEHRAKYSAARIERRRRREEAEAEALALASGSEVVTT